MLIQLAFAYAPQPAGEDGPSDDMQVTRLASSSVTDVQSGCEGCAAYVAECVVVAAKQALATYRAAKGT